MDGAQFWTLIDQARPGKRPTDPSADPEQLRRVLIALSNDELVGFAQRFNQKLIELNRWEIWGAGYTGCGGMGDDGFHYFRSWIIGKGLATFQTALTRPDDLADSVGPRDRIQDGLENEGLEYVAIEILTERGEPDPREEFEVFPDDATTGEPFEEATVSESYPRMASVFAKSFAPSAGSLISKILSWFSGKT